MHPFPLPPDVNYTGSTQIRQMPGDFGLRRSEDLDEVADAHFIAAHQVQQAQARPIGERTKQRLHVEGFLHGFSLSRQYIRIDAYV